MGEIYPGGGIFQGTSITVLDKNLLLQLEMIAALPDPVFVLTESGRYAALIGGRDRSTYHDGSCLVDFSLYDVLPRAKADWFLDEIRITLREDCLRIVEYVLSADDVEGVDASDGPDGDLWFEGRVQPMPSRVDGERAVLWVASNVSRRHALESALQRLSETDELTGVHNRRKLIKTLDDRLHDARTGTETFALLIVDIDHFKKVNDTWGHLAGDCVLRQFAQLCADLLGERGFIARMGGEEFAIVLAPCSAAQAMAAAEQIRDRVASQHFQLDCGTRLSITVSIGISIVQPDYRHTDDMIRGADDALYAAKKNGRNAIEIQSPPQAQSAGQHSGIAG
ncbi:GGDEF domain-containing protein [Salinisphaera aquimarina]|uniref:diguanylate cyclase n=1 Tax=Salinisphaera aquimarina TaxID=2094031 RepID=A0ABV7EWC8_9GAMM